MDDVLIFGGTKEEHDEKLAAVLNVLSNSGLTLNEKCKFCKFCKTNIKFIGHIIDGDGIRADPDKVKYITEMERPSNITDLRRFLGLANHLGKFSPKLAEHSKL